VRPHSDGVRKPRHNIIIRGKGTPGGLAGAYQGEAKAFSRGRAEPAPPRVEDPGYDGLGGKSWDNAEGDFLGGTRSPRPRSKAGRKPGHVMTADVLAGSRWPKGGNVGVGVMPCVRACGARPSTGG